MRDNSNPLPLLLLIMATWGLCMGGVWLLPEPMKPKHWLDFLVPKRSQKHLTDAQKLLPLDRPAPRPAKRRAPKRLKPYPISRILPRPKWWRYPPYLRELELKQPPIEVRDAKVLSAFLHALAQTQKKRGSTRISFYGDSLLLQGSIVSPLRRAMQKAFGDAGHGALTFGSPFDKYEYFHRDIFHKSDGLWKVWRLNSPRRKDGKYGLAGFVFAPEQTSRTFFGARKRGTLGASLNRVDLWYRRSPKAGTLQLLYRRLGQKRWHKRTVSTKGPEGSFGLWRLTLPPGKWRFTLRASSPHLRLYDIQLYRDKPGVIVDALGSFGASMFHLRAFDRAHWKSLLRWAKTKLLLLFFSANDADLLRKIKKQKYRASARIFFRDLAALSREVGASCMVMGPSTRGALDKSKPRTPWRVTLLRKILHKEALDAGCAFWDTMAAMGDDADAITRWSEHEPTLLAPDMIHLTLPGSKIVGRLLYNALRGALAGRMAIVPERFRGKPGRTWKWLQRQRWRERRKKRR